LNFLVISISVTIIFGAMAIGYWYYQVIPSSNAFNSNYMTFLQFTGNDKTVDRFGGEFGDQSFHIMDTREKVVSSLNEKLEIQVDIISRHSDTEEVVFNAVDNYVINRFTKKHVDNSNLYYAFPNNVEKKTYEFLHPIIHRPTTLDFVKAIEIEDMEAYVFQCAPRINDNTSAFKQFEGRKIYVNYKCTVIVEPKTGNVLYMELNWHNFFVNDDGTPISDAQIGGVTSTEFFENEQIILTKKDLERYFLFNIIFPSIILVFFGLISVIQYIIGKMYSVKQKRTIDELNIERSKNEFIQIFSHELKTPLVLIRGYCQILIEKDYLDRIKQKEFLEKIYLESEDLLKMIKKMVFIQKLDSHIFKIEIKEIFLDEFLENIMNSFRNIAKQKNIDLIFNSPEHKSFRGDESLLHHVFDNIINNAISILPDKGGIIQLSSEFGTDKVSFTISNNGPKIPEKLLENIFLKYYQVDQSLSSYYSGSSGLGLSICKKIIEMHNGKIYAWNDDKKINFSFWIPI
jgi:signal transduction histidine kinase